MKTPIEISGSLTVDSTFQKVRLATIPVGEAISLKLPSHLVRRRIYFCAYSNTFNTFSWNIAGQIVMKLNGQKVGSVPFNCWSNDSGVGGALFQPFFTNSRWGSPGAVGPEVITVGQENNSYII